MRLKNIQIIWKMQNKKCLKNKIFLPCHSSVKWSDPGDFLKAQFVIFRCQKYVKKRVHGNEKMNLPCVFKKCPESLHFTLLLWVHLWVWHCLILSFYTLKKNGYKIVHLTLSLITTAGMLMMSVFYSFR